MGLLSRRTFLYGAASTTVGAAYAHASAVGVEIPVMVAPAPVGAPRGPQPIPQPYPPQPGFTLVSSLEAVTTAGNYQLAGDEPNDPNGMNSYTLPVGAVIDAAGYSITKTGLNFQSNTALKNAVLLNTSVLMNGDNISLTNSSIVSNLSRLPSYLVVIASGLGSVGSGANITLENNFLQGASDDPIILWYDRSTNQPVTGFAAKNNIIVDAPDCGIEGVTRWDNCVIQNNLFRGCNIAIGDFVNSELHNCVFKDNHAEKSGATSHLFFFQASADDDAIATSYWGANGTVFSGNSYS